MRKKFISISISCRNFFSFTISKYTLKWYLWGIHCYLAKFYMGWKLKSKMWAGVTLWLIFTLNKIKRATWNILEMNTQIFNHFHTFLFAKMRIFSSEFLLMLQFSICLHYWSPLHIHGCLPPCMSYCTAFMLLSYSCALMLLLYSNTLAITLEAMVV